MTCSRGGGTTDYAVDIYHAALRDRRYRCFLGASTRLPMMYMRECLRATSALLAAPEEALTRRVYNVAAMSFTPEELAAAIQSRVPGLEVDYDPDFRQVSDLLIDTPNAPHLEIRKHVQV